MANLNQAMTHVKQTCAQLAEENGDLKDKNSELLAKIEALEHEKDNLTKKVIEAAHQREKSIVHTPDHKVRQRVCVTPAKPIPEETERDTLLHENTKLKQEFQCLQTNFQLTSSKSLQLKKEVKELEKTLLDLQAQHDFVLEERDEMKTKIEEMKTALSANSGLKQNEIEKCGQLKEEVALLQKQLESLQNQNLDLKTKLKKETQQSTVRKDGIKALEIQLKTLAEEKTSVESDLAQSQTQLEEIQDDLSSLRAVRSQQTNLEQQASDAVASYKGKMVALKAERQELREQLEVSRKTLDDALGKVQELEEREASLKTKVAGLEAKGVTLNKQAMEHSHLSGEMKELRTKLDEISGQLEDANVQKNAIEKAKEKADAKVEQLSKFNKMLSQEAASNHELAIKLQKEVEKIETASLEAKEYNHEKERQNKKLTRELENLTLKLTSTESQKSVFEAEVDKLLKKLEELEQCNFELSTKLSDVEGESSSTKASKDVSEARVLELENRLQLLEGALLERDSIISGFKCESELMESENATLVSQVTSLSEMVAARNCKVDALNSQLLMFESDTRDIVDKVAELETSHSQCASIRKDLESEMQRLKETLEATQSKEREGEATLLSLKLKVMELQESNNGLEAIITHLEDDKKSESARSSKVADKNTQLESCVHSMKQELRAKDASLKAAYEEAEFMKKCKIDLESSLNAEIKSVNEKCDEMRGQLQSIEQTNVELTSRVRELEADLREEKHQAATRLHERDSASEQLSCVQTDLNTAKDQLIMVKAELRSTKSTLDYQERKMSELEKEKKMVESELETVTEQYETLRQSALSMLEQSDPLKDENVLSISTTKKLKGILKNPSKQKVLQSVENVSQ